MSIKEYNREKAIAYAKKWAYSRNPEYYNFDPVGGDCTSFVSQCIYAGSGVMNYSKYGWYYKNANNKSASWSGVKYLYNFLISNTGVGPFGKMSDIEEIEAGDIAQLSFDGITFGHSLFIVKKNENDFDHILTATHTNDSYARPISSWDFADIRFVHIKGVRE